ncbi:MAG TPA: kynureninase, partial [Povalibacter sp.]|nr:kynureninase [Povalibacter sp.]
ARLAGAAASEVVAMNSLTVNLHLMLTSFYRPTRERHRILIEGQAFSSDRYAVSAQIMQRGFDPATSLLEVEPRSDEACIRTDDLCELIEQEGPHIATVLLPGVQYLTGQRFDMATVAACARRQGCAVGFDLAHAIGNVPLSLHDWNADFAVWCSYKYLNAGPGAIGGCFVHERHARSTDLPRLAGWWGHDKASRFEMPETFAPLPGAEGWQVSNPPILAAAPLLASLELFERAEMARLRTKSQALTGLLETLLQARLGQALTILTPPEPAARGCQLSIRLQRSPQQARAVHAMLTAAGYVCDWREPDVIRVAPVPLYNTFTEVWDFVTALESALRHPSGM